MTANPAVVYESGQSETRDEFLTRANPEDRHSIWESKQVEILFRFGLSSVSLLFQFLHFSIPSLTLFSVLSVALVFPMFVGFLNFC